MLNNILQDKVEGGGIKNRNKKRRIKNKGSVLLGKEENKELFKLLDFDQYVICSGIASVMKTNKYLPSDWEEIGHGVIVYIKDYDKKLYSLRLYCLPSKKCLWEHILYPNFMPVFGFQRIDTLEYVNDGEIYCIHFSHPPEAELFYTLFKKKFEKDMECEFVEGNSSHFSSGKLRNEEILNKNNSNNNIKTNINQSVKDLLKTAGYDYKKMEEEDLKFAKTFLEEYEGKEKSNVNLEIVSTIGIKEEPNIRKKGPPTPLPLPLSIIKKETNNDNKKTNNDNKITKKISKDEGKYDDLMSQIKQGKSLNHVDQKIKSYSMDNQKTEVEFGNNLAVALRNIMQERRQRLSEDEFSSSSSSNGEWD
uniref:WH1 domain-containing protein n=1 Tax=Strongyloides stercoralis TaxID=6248 RepID=A0A0K0E1C4_STRER